MVPRLDESIVQGVSGAEPAVHHCVVSTLVNLCKKLSNAKPFYVILRYFNLF